jgi:hypothetical protein
MTRIHKINCTDVKLCVEKIRRVIRRKIHKETQLELHKPTFLCGCEAGMRRRKGNRIQAAEMIILREVHV